MISDQRIAELMGWSANPAHVTGVLGGGPDDLPARVRAVAQAAAEAALAQQAQEPVAWTLTKTLEKRETTTTGYLWFSDPQNSAWTPLYISPKRRKPLTNEQIRRAKPVCAHFESFRAGIRFMEREIGLHA